MEEAYRDLARETKNIAYVRMADTIKNSTRKEEADATELDFITDELEMATDEFIQGMITEERLNTIIADHARCLEKWVNATYLK